MNYILGGGGFSSRLMREVRSKAGLAYGIGSGFQAGKFPGAFVVALQTKNTNANEAIKLILKQLQRDSAAPGCCHRTRFGQALYDRKLPA